MWPEDDAYGQAKDLTFDEAIKVGMRELENQNATAA
jgi:hypothetical protein